MEKHEAAADREPRHIGRYVNQLSKEIRYACNSYLVKSGVTVTGEQCRLLGYIRSRTDKGECVYQRDIEREFGIKRSSVASILANLEKGGYIIREGDEKDARLKRVFLTQQGRELDMSMYENILHVESVISRGMSEEETDMFISLLKRALENIENSDEKERDN